MAMAESDGNNTVRERLFEAVKEGGIAVTQTAGKVADVALSAVRSSDGAVANVADADARATAGAAGGSFELAQRTAGAMMFGRAVNWDGIMQAQSEFMRA